MIESYNEYFKLKHQMFPNSNGPEVEPMEEKKSTVSEKTNDYPEHSQREEFTELPQMFPVTSSEEETSFSRAARPNCRGMVHVVKEGDTLYKIAMNNQLKVLDLLLANPYVNVYNLQVGDEICVPVKGIPVTDNRVPYVIRRGDTIGAILKKTSLTFEELVQYNPFLLDLPLPVNNVIFLPANTMKKTQDS